MSRLLYSIIAAAGLAVGAAVPASAQPGIDGVIDQLGRVLRAGGGYGGDPFARCGRPYPGETAREKAEREECVHRVQRGLDRRGGYGSSTSAYDRDRYNRYDRYGYGDYDRYRRDPFARCGRP